MNKCNKKHCHECSDCGYKRPMTKGEAEIAELLDEVFVSELTNIDKKLSKEVDWYIRNAEQEYEKHGHISSNGY